MLIFNWLSTQVLWVREQEADVAFWNDKEIGGKSMTQDCEQWWLERSGSIQDV
jgi:hypothetical protein